MEDYKNIMKLIDNKLAEQEGVIEYYRNKQKEWEEHTNELTSENFKLKEEIEQLKEKIEELTF